MVSANFLCVEPVKQTCDGTDVSKVFLICWLLLALTPSLAPAQSPAPPAFPEALLEGMSKFNLAILLQGDIRGNFGPCG